MVKLVGQDATANVHWRRCRHIAGPGITVTQAVQNSALHDQQRFKVEAFDSWGFDEDGQVQVLVRWRGFDDSERTWEPLAQLYEDVPVMLRKWVHGQDEPELAGALRDVIVAQREDDDEASDVGSDE